MTRRFIEYSMIPTRENETFSFQHANNQLSSINPNPFRPQRNRNFYEQVLQRRALDYAQSFSLRGFVVDIVLFTCGAAKKVECCHVSKSADKQKNTFLEFKSIFFFASLATLFFLIVVALLVFFVFSPHRIQFCEENYLRVKLLYTINC